MQNPDTRQPRRSSCSVGFWTGLVLLVIGFVIGGLGSAIYWQRSAHTNRPTDRGTPVSTARSSQLPEGASSPQFTQWDSLQQMSIIQSQIDQIFQHSLDQIRAGALPVSFPAKPGYSLSMDVRDLKNQYQVRAFLPDTKPSDVKVNLKGNELTVDMAKKVTEKPTAQNNETAVSEWGNYQETVQLAGQLKENQMKVQRLPHELIISVPKA